MPEQWTRVNAEKLITLFQEHECLWNVKNKEYQDRDKREKAYHYLFNNLKEDVTALTLNDIKQKMMSVRSQHRKELREINASKRSGAGADDVRVPRLWCFHLLDFLRPSTKIRKTSSSIECETIENLNYTLDSMDDTSSTPSTSSQTQRKQTKRAKKESAAQKEFSDLRTALEKNIERKYECLGEQIVSTLNEMQNEDNPYSAKQNNAF